MTGPGTAAGADSCYKAKQDIQVREGLVMMRTHDDFLRALALSLFLAAGSLASPAWGQKYPNKPVRIIVTTQTGSATDLMSRYFGEALFTTTGQRFLVENRVGAGGNIGAAAAARAAPDGYTLFMGGLGTSVLNQYLYPSREFFPEKDFDPVNLIARHPNIFAATPSLPVNSIQELIALAKEKPGAVNIALTNSSVRLIFGVFAKASGAPLFPVAYATLGPAVNDVMAGRVSVILETVVALRPHVASGKVKPLAITTLKESSLVPNLRSVSEQGVAGFGDMVGWNVLLVPKGAPRDIIQFLNVEVNKVLLQSETRQRLADIGAEAASGSADDVAAFIAAERSKWAAIVKASGIKAE